MKLYVFLTIERYARSFRGEYSSGHTPEETEWAIHNALTEAQKSLYVDEIKESIILRLRHNGQPLDEEETQNLRNAEVAFYPAKNAKPDLIRTIRDNEIGAILTDDQDRVLLESVLGMVDLPTHSDRYVPGYSRRPKVNR